MTFLVAFRLDWEARTHLSTLRAVDLIGHM